MSSKVTVASSQRVQGEPAFVLYEDVLDSFGKDGTADAPLYLRLVGVSLELQTMDEAGATVTVTLPRKLARELGLDRLGAVVAGVTGGASGQAAK